jgi:hypothetical protein
MQLVDRIEKRRFVGREFLLWLWFESELFDATLRTASHGPFGLWLEKRLTLSIDKRSTRIIGPSPGFGREAKAALLTGQLPESAGLRISIHDQETGFVLKAEGLAIGGLKLATVLDRKEEQAPALVREMSGGPRKKSKKPVADDDSHELFYERMQLTAELEEIVEALYADFRALRLCDAWNEYIVPTMRAWARSETVDAEVYGARRWPQPDSGGRQSTTGARPTPPISEAARSDEATPRSAGSSATNRSRGAARHSG